MSVEQGQGLSRDAASVIEDLNAKTARQDLLGLDDLLALMSVLRDRALGCPWDREQTFASIAPYTIEEAYEVADAIVRGDMRDLMDELGDLLLQVVYHAQMASEAAEFDFADVADAITRKMVRRHPHIFGDEETRASVEIQGLWDRVKAQEAKAKAFSEGSGSTDRAESILDAVPVRLPALARAAKLQKRVAKVGFDWTDTAQILEKVKEETAEIEAELPEGRQDRIADEVGDLMFVVVNLARRLSIDPETALMGANAKFERRFRYIEARLEEAGRTVETALLEEMEALWREAKSHERQAAD